MRILFCGDVVGRSGRDAVQQYIPMLRKKLSLDVVVVNGENSARGFGLTRKICQDFVELGVDVITGGDHCFDQKEIMNFIGSFPQLLRPENLPKSLPGTGVRSYNIAGKRVVVIHLLCQIFVKMAPDNPFTCVDEILAKYQLGKNADAIIVDVHGEATSERMGLGHFLDGRVSMVVGTHTHVPTADNVILSRGTAYQTDAGMCGDYDSVIGFNKSVSIQGFIHKVRSQRMEVATGEATLCGVYLEIDDVTGLATRFEPVRLGGRLGQAMPEVSV